MLQFEVLKLHFLLSECNTSVVDQVLRNAYVRLIQLCAWSGEQVNGVFVYFQIFPKQRVVVAAQSRGSAATLSTLAPEPLC